MSSDKTICYVGLGSNLGESIKNIQDCTLLISENIYIEVKKCASIYQSKPWGNINQNDFINTVVEIHTTLTADDLLIEMQKIEKVMGRERKEKWGPRIIDIDILTYNNKIINQPNLIVPHPYLTQRAFVLVPLYEINKKLNIPIQGNIVNFVTKYLNNEGLTKIKLL